MNGLAIFAFVIMPMIVVTIGYVAMRLHDASIDRYLKNNSLDGKNASPPALTPASPAGDRSA
ncbi:hypothetical protein [Methylobacterium sp. Leaf108]|uniref:hypothetical protein n=1 Tax=Methylobacterium sp. Leaf108 TaxID=1736256 RepID=UPI001AEC000C|nr:hypothetical protein [Methylobacterium sp. Leaf108]